MKRIQKEGDVKKLCHPYNQIQKVPLNLNAFGPLNAASATATSTAKNLTETTAFKNRGRSRKTSPKQAKLGRGRPKKD